MNPWKNWRLDSCPRLDKVWPRPALPPRMSLRVRPIHRHLRGGMASAVIAGMSLAAAVGLAPIQPGQAQTQNAAPVSEAVAAGTKGAQVYCFMRANGNIHEVSWAAAYALVKRQSASLFKTSPEHAAVMITEAVVQNPAAYPDCGRYLGDLYTKRRTVVISSGPGTIPAGAVPVGAAPVGGNGGTQTRW